MASRKGSPNKIGSQARENVVAVFTRLGGTAAMAEWARENQTEFYRLYARLIPSEVTGTIDLRNVKELSDDELIGIATAGSLGATGPQECLPEPGELH